MTVMMRLIMLADTGNNLMLGVTGNNLNGRCYTVHTESLVLMSAN